MKPLRMQFFLLSFVLVIFAGCSNSEGETSEPVNGMETYTGEEANVSTVIGESWEEVEVPHSDPTSLNFQVNENTFVEIHQSVQQISTSDPENPTDILQTAYEESDSYQDFVQRFVDSYSQSTGLEYEEIDTVEEDIPIFHNTSGETKTIFAVIEAENTPYFVHLSVNSDSNEIEVIQDEDYYSNFKEVIKQTQPLE